MQIVILLAFMIGLSSREFIQDSSSPTALLWVGVYLLGVAVLGMLDVRLAAKSLRNGGQLGSAGFRHHRLFTLATRVWLLAGLGALAMLGYGGWVMHTVGAWRWPLLADVVLLGPFVLAMLLVWAIDYPFHRAMRERMSLSEILAGRPPLPCWTRRQYVRFNVRHHLLFLAVPIGLILLLVDTADLYVTPMLPRGDGGEVAQLGLYLGVIALVFLLAPLLIVRIWKTRPLPPSPLRENLLGLCRQLKIRFRDIRVWQTGGVLANAGAMGLIGPVRYVLLSDALLEQMPVERVRGIFAHEAGHIRHHHIFFSGLFAIAAATWSISFAWGTARVLPLASWQEETLAISFLAMAWAVGFGFVSKRFERQSDVVGAWASDPAGPAENGAISLEGAETFAAGLEQVADLNGIPHEQRNWRHGRIADRVAYVRKLGLAGGNRRHIDRLVQRIQWGLVLAALTGAGLLTLHLAWR